MFLIGVTVEFNPKKILILNKVPVYVQLVGYNREMTALNTLWKFVKIVKIHEWWRHVSISLHTAGAREIWIDQLGLSRWEKIHCPHVNVSWQERHWNQATFLIGDCIKYSDNYHDKLCLYDKNLMRNTKKSVPYKTSDKSWYYQHCLQETYKIFLVT